ncbi:hydrogen gas-evolving membrane-bound hydrogenase subunit E [Methanimicrococcus hongohii]|uniref:hydrogen gas-evolving membrane-bound hydrogenase subunit E n=1 Tax=Methanimicrococcus hongohii TaxID=3028295 RepID=UPI00292CC182|nr:hydrogen gas-evolving membrane-bound hydrogenase subunit E [Methanimicrococcus sp. Hf6]
MITLDPFYFIALIVLLPFAMTLAVPSAYKIMREKVGWFAAAVAAVCFLLIASMIPSVMNGTNLAGAISWIPSLSVNLAFYADGLAVLLGLIVSFIGILILSYSNKYLSKDEDLVRYYQYLLVFMGSMFGVAFSDNLVQLFIFWELTSISSFMLIGYYRKTKESIYGATKALLITGGAGLFMFIGFMCLYSITGTYGISEMLTNPEMLSAVKESPLFTVTLILILIGALAKSAQGPFFIWLPNAMEAPTPVSAFLHSATMVKAGIFLVARLHPMFSGTTDWFVLVACLGLITMIVAGFLALKQTDLKAILAFSTISQLAYLMTMFGFTTAAEPGIGVSAAVFHLLNHATFKACLFLLVGIIAHELHTRDITKMGGLRKEMPITFILMVIAAAAMAGIPPLNGYLSKELFYESSVTMAEALGGGIAYLIPVLAVIGGVLTFAYSFRLILKIFTGKRTQDPDVPKHVHDPSWVLLAPPAILAVLIVAIGLFPTPFIDALVQPAINAILPGAEHLHVALWHGITPAFIMTIITFALGILLYTQYDKVAAWQVRFSEKHPKFSLNYIYNTLVDNAFKFGSTFGRMLQKGSPRRYVGIMLAFIVFMIAIPLGFAFLTGQPIFSKDFIFKLAISEMILFVLIVLAAWGASVLPRYVPMILASSALGFFVAMLYAYLKAPDLAMTQLCVETLSTIMFLLVFMKLKTKEAIRPETNRIRLRNSLVALCCAAALFFVLMGADLFPAFESFSHYFMDKGIDLTGGKNIVNVIVVDFRGYDTLGEISVLVIAALTVYNLISSRTKKEKAAATAADTAPGNFVPSCPIPGAPVGGNQVLGHVPCDEVIIDKSSDKPAITVENKSVNKHLNDDSDTAVDADKTVGTSDLDSGSDIQSDVKSDTADPEVKK